MLIREKDGLSLRELQPTDASLLLKWLSDPAVLEWYEGRDRAYDAEQIQEDFYSDPEGEELRGIWLLEGRAIGYMQMYPLEDEERELYGYTNGPAIIYGMDQFIGEGECRDRGIGTRIVAAAVDYLFEGRGADLIVMDPQARNERALRVYEKNGFARVKRLASREWHEGEWRDCWLVEKKRDYAKEA